VKQWNQNQALFGTILLRLTIQVPNAKSVTKYIREKGARRPVATGGPGGAQPPLKAVTAPPWKNWDITTTYFQKHIFYPSKN
jgi:hypothetical protein